MTSLVESCNCDIVWIPRSKKPMPFVLKVSKCFQFQPWQVTPNVVAKLFK